MSAERTIRSITDAEWDDFAGAERFGDDEKRPLVLETEAGFFVASGAGVSMFVGDDDLEEYYLHVSLSREWMARAILEIMKLARLETVKGMGFKRI